LKSLELPTPEGRMGKDKLWSYKDRLKEKMTKWAERYMLWQPKKLLSIAHIYDYEHL
jgi:hypothetical protein